MIKWLNIKALSATSCIDSMGRATTFAGSKAAKQWKQSWNWMKTFITSLSVNKTHEKWSSLVYTLWFVNKLHGLVRIDNDVVFLNTVAVLPGM